MIHYFKKFLDGSLLADIYRYTRDEWVFRHRQFRKTPWGYFFSGRSDMQTGDYEFNEVLLIQKHLETADTFVDVGANIGYFTCFARSMGKYTLAIEPFAGNLHYLYANLKINNWVDDIEVYPIGVSDKLGIMALYGGGTGASLIEGWAGISPNFHSTISLSTLDILLGNRFEGKQLIIKIDVEGAEYKALQGARNILKSTPYPIWLIEITLSEHLPGEGNPYFLKTFEIFWESGYCVFSVENPNREISKSEIEEYVNTHNQPNWKLGNYLFIHNSSCDL